MKKLLTPQAIRDRLGDKPVLVEIDTALLSSWMEAGWYLPAYRVEGERQQFLWARLSSVVIHDDRDTVSLEITTTAPEGIA